MRADLRQADEASRRRDSASRALVFEQAPPVVTTTVDDDVDVATEASATPAGNAPTREEGRR